MQKWREVLFIILFSIIGGFIDFVAVKSGIGKIGILADIDVFMLFLLMIIMILAFYAIYKIYKSKKQFGITKFKVISSTKKRSRNFLIFFLLCTIFVCAISLISKDDKRLPLNFMILILAIMSGLHVFGNDGISENRVLHCGVYYRWSDIKYCKVESETLLEIITSRKFVGKKYDNIIRFNFDSKHKDDINSFFIEKVNI
ncbi:hypothetical protein [Clostridium sp.]|uniref:hypothetical protein n=1 Tax=Clostridium sp. TaxID=1506 RepID=UPI00284F370A|nr:hypothetical protein [Clostridium sp.]MDR3598745.1 hypothetical protein [Clostridium sp.]